MHRRRFGFALLPLGVLAGCGFLKPENRVRLGMSPQDVERLVGPVRHQKWLYWNADKSHRIDVHFEGDHVDLAFLVVTKDGVQIVESSRNTGRDATRRVIKETDLRKQEIIAPSSLPLPAYGATSASVLKLLGVPQEAAIHYVAHPLYGEFENGKLVRWMTTPGPPPPI